MTGFPVLQDLAFLTNIAQHSEAHVPNRSDVSSLRLSLSRQALVSLSCLLLLIAVNVQDVAAMREAFHEQQNAVNAQAQSIVLMSGQLQKLQTFAVC